MGRGRSNDFIIRFIINLNDLKRSVIAGPDRVCLREPSWLDTKKKTIE